MKRGVKVAIGLLVFVLVVVVAAWLVDRKLKGLGHPGISKFIHQVAVNYPKGFAVDPLVLEIKVKKGDLEQLQRVVDDARERGVIVPEGNEYVPAELTGPEGSFKAKIRIKGKLTDHVKGEKWSFRVISRKNGGFQGMRRFSLQHPGTRNYLHDWFYHQLMEGEGIIALRYGFIRLNFNGDDLGIYAYEEHFGPELLENNERLEGPIFRFDPGLYWEHRLNEMRKLKIDAPYAEYQAAAVDAYGSNEIASDPVRLRQFEEAVALIDGFRRGELTASQVFDADKIARRHAILDLIGGHHSMDFSDVKFYYDPIARKIEPVAYESFSAFPIRSLAGSNRYVGRRSESQDLHDAYFNDPELLRAYVHHLERISRASYLDSVFNVLGPALDSASAIIYQEFPWKEMDRTIFVNNQKVIRRLLDVPKGAHAHFRSWKGDTLQILMIPIDALPLEIKGIKIDGGELIRAVTPTILPCRMPGRMGEPIIVKFRVPSVTDTLQRSISIVYNVLGASVQKELEVFPFAMDQEIASRVVAGSEVSDPGSFPFIQVDPEKKEIHLISGSWKIDRDLVLPEGFLVRGDDPLELDLIKGAQLISNSPIDLKGNEERPVRIFSSDGSGGAIFLIGANNRSTWDHVQIESFGKAEHAMLSFQDSPVEMLNCRIGGEASRDLFHFVRSTASFTDCILAGGRDQLTSTFSRIKLIDHTMHGAQDDAMIFNGGMIDLQNVRVENSKGTALKMNVRAEVKAARLDLIGAAQGIDLSEGSALIVEKGSIRTTGIGVVIGKKAMRYGPSSATLNELLIEANGSAMSIGAGNSVDIDGVPANVNDTPDQ
ncbi:MAG: CotH kinase family protein [Bacteroidota bacterium]|nr:CotH kinase family protein [Bacteroidota bacterium]